MKKHITNFILIAFLLFCSIEILLNGTDIGHNITANIDWSQKKTELKNTHISKITFWIHGTNSKEIDLMNSKNDAFISSLIHSKFYRSNWQGMVDTDCVILLIYNNGTKESLEYCGGSIFQITYKGRMFSIKNKELEQSLLNYDFKL